MAVKTYSLVRENGDIYILDSTTSVSLASPGKLSEHILESGDTVADHYVNSNDTISFQGTISSVKRAGYKEDLLSRNPQSYMEGLRKIKSNKELFTLYHISDLSKTPNCLFTSLNFEQNTRRGITANSSSVAVSFTARQIRFGQLATIESRAVSSAKDILSKKLDAGPAASVDVSAQLRDKEKVGAAISEKAKRIVGLRADNLLL